jgi:hypothetical protein
MNQVSSTFFRCKPLIRKRRGYVIKDSFKPLEDAQVFPDVRRISFRGRVHSLKLIIIDKMILRRNISSGKVSNKSNVLRMDWRHTNILPTTGSRLPLGNFTTRVSETGCKNINRASPGMSSAKSLAIICSLRKDFNWSNARLGVGSVIV